MQRTWSKCIVVACFIGSTGTVNAGTLRITDGAYGNGPGGQFKVSEVTGFAGVFDGTGDTFQTFCVERFETINLGDTYDYEIATSALSGGIGGSPDPLDERTAFLYTHFRNGVLDSIVSGYSYAADSSADALQNAIWFIEEEVSAVTGLAADLVSVATTAVESGTWTGYGQVRILRLYELGTLSFNRNRQDQLTMIPLPGPFGLAFVGFIGAGFVARRRRLA